MSEAASSMLTLPIEPSQSGLFDSVSGAQHTTPSELVQPISGTNVFTPNVATVLPETMDIDQPPTNATAETSKSDVVVGRQAGDDHALHTNHPVQQAFDIAKSIKGMYRVLDLINDQGSGGLGKYLSIFRK